MRTVTVGPGDPETWPASTGHPHDPRNDGDEYGPCSECGDECYRIVSEGEWDADEDGRYWSPATFLHLECDPDHEPEDDDE